MSNISANWAPYVTPEMVQQTASLGNPGTHGFWRPADSALPTGAELGNFLGANGPAGYTNRAIKYDGALSREMLGNTTNFLNTQLGKGFGGVEDMFNRYGSLGGLGGVAQSGNASAVYRPGGQAMATNNTQPWGATNPFNATF